MKQLIVLVYENRQKLIFTRLALIEVISILFPRGYAVSKLFFSGK